LEDMQLWWRDLLLVATGSPAPPVHRDRRSELERQAAKRGRERIVRGLREIELTAGAVERNVTPRLALEALLLRLN
ncbi:MAG TPA: DNA polymerase III subunit delta', partial [Chloroflexota bacterium]|nr:DNA polymerase III subunit delta' [Chloroflexota bacterium]